MSFFGKPHESKTEKRDSFQQSRPLGNTALHFSLGGLRGSALGQGPGSGHAGHRWALLSWRTGSRPSPESWREGRWAPRWKKCLARISRLNTQLTFLDLTSPPRRGLHPGWALHPSYTDNQTSFLPTTDFKCQMEATYVSDSLNML